MTDDPEVKIVTPKWKPGDIVCLFWQNPKGDLTSNPEPLLIIDVNPDATGPHPVYKLMRHDGSIRTRYEFELWDPLELERLQAEEYNTQSLRGTGIRAKFLKKESQKK